MERCAERSSEDVAVFLPSAAGELAAEDHSFMRFLALALTPKEAAIVGIEDYEADLHIE